MSAAKASGQRHVAVVTGGRADFGILLEPLRHLSAEPSIKISVVATGMHLDPSYGDTLGEIERAGYAVAAKVPILEGDDSAAAIGRATGRGVVGFVDLFSEMAPDLVLVLGDRYEIFAVAQAAFILRIPIAHIGGGDVTSGALDDGLRHSITKLSSLHFTTNEDSARRVRQLGEQPDRVFSVGTPALDLLLKTKRLSAAEIEARLGHAVPDRFLLATYHPATLGDVPATRQADILLSALAEIGDDVGVIFTLSNADEGGRQISERIGAFVAQRKNAFVFAALGSEMYHNLMMKAAAVIGNSSSGLYEAPSFGVPTVNIGNRQDGRQRAESVIDCPLERVAIVTTIKRALALGRVTCANPYGDGHSSTRIAGILLAQADWQSLVYKSFTDWAEPKP